MARKRGGLGGLPVQHQRMVEHYGDLVERRTREAARELAAGNCAQASQDMVDAAFAVGALGAHVASGKVPDMAATIRAYRQDILNIRQQLLRCGR